MSSVEAVRGMHAHAVCQHRKLCVARCFLFSQMQFSAIDVMQAKREAFVPDASWPLRTFLMSGYDKQKVQGRGM